ncbi:MAG: Gfo/Idh/MocA family oxidoreductase [Ginsengibacter sp.]
MKKIKEESLTRRNFLTRTAALSTFFIVPRSVLGGKGYTPPSDRVTLGFIGNGRQSHDLLDFFVDTKEVQILAGSDVYEVKRNYFKLRVDVAQSDSKKGCDVYNDFRELLNRKDIDAVVIASPDYWHAVHTLRAAEAGKDIYGEKPLAHTIDEGRAMVTAVSKYKRIFQTGSMQRSWPEFRQTAELVRNGYIGDIKTIKVSVGGPPVDYDLPKEKLPEGLDWDLWLGPNSYYHYNSQLAPTLPFKIWGKWRNYKPFGGGEMADWGAHMFDIVQWALDMDRSGPTNIIPPNGKEYPFLTYRYANGITMTHEDFGKWNAIRFVGTKGQIDVQRNKLETSPATLADYKIGPNEKHVYYSDNHYKDWLNGIRKRTQPICDVETGHRSGSVCSLGNIAYELKRPLEWDPIKEKFINDIEADKLIGREMRKPWTL